MVVLVEIGIVVLIMYLIYDTYKLIHSRLYGEQRNNKLADIEIIKGIGLIITLIAVLIYLLVNK